MARALSKRFSLNVLCVLVYWGTPPACLHLGDAGLLRVKQYCFKAHTPNVPLGPHNEVFPNIRYTTLITAMHKYNSSACILQRK